MPLPPALPSLGSCSVLSQHPQHCCTPSVPGDRSWAAAPLGRLHPGRQWLMSCSLQPWWAFSPEWRGVEHGSVVITCLFFHESPPLCVTLVSPFVNTSIPAFPGAALLLLAASLPPGRCSGGAGSELTPWLCFPPPAGSTPTSSFSFPLLPCSSHAPLPSPTEFSGCPQERVSNVPNIP